MGESANKEHYVYMKAYSPYDNIERKAYPWILVTTSLNDSQVGYWEPAKWVAKLRAMKTDTNPLLIKINMAGGHGGSSGRYDVSAGGRSATRSCLTRWVGGAVGAMFRKPSDDEIDVYGLTHRGLVRAFQSGSLSDRIAAPTTQRPAVEPARSRPSCRSPRIGSLR